MPNQASNETSSSDRNWGAEVRRAWGEEYYKADTAYEFSNGREFKSTDASDSGIYSS